MSQGNAAAQIGTIPPETPATDKIPSIGPFVRDTTPPGPGADGPYIGIQGATYWDRNWLGEDAGFLAPSNNGIIGTTNAGWVGSTPPDVGNPLGKKAIWSTSVAPLTVPADGRVAVTAGGVATAASGTGAYQVMIPAATVIPGTALAPSWFWAFEYQAP